MRVPYFADWNFTLGEFAPIAASDSWFWCMFEEAFAAEIKNAVNIICGSNGELGLTKLKK
jgi:hypothetical protein